MTMTMTVNDRLVELGTLVDNTDTAPQRVGARLIEKFFDEFKDFHLMDYEQIANHLYYLTDIQVRDYALGLIDPAKSTQQINALEYLLNVAPIDTAYINAPASLLAVLHYELGNQQAALMILQNAQEDYPLAQLLHRVFLAGWAPGSFAAMRKELHPQVTEGIFGEDNE